jgi:tetratricopeptide (TPR) repeat protein
MDPLSTSVWIASKLSQRAGDYLAARRRKDAPEIKRALVIAVSRGARNAVDELWSDDDRVRRSVRKSLLGQRRRNWPLVNGTALEDLVAATRLWIQTAEPAIPAVIGPGDESLVAVLCRSILREVEHEATRGMQVLNPLWQAFRQHDLVRLTALGGAVADRPELAPAPEATARWRDYWHPDQSGAGFVGRDADLRRIRDAVDTDDGIARVQSLAGFGGIGKTALAIAYANRAAHYEGRVFYDFHSYGTKLPQTADQALVAMLPTVSGRSVLEVGTLTAEERLALWRSVTAGRRLLMVWDNVKSADQFADLMVRGPGCATIVTSRDHVDVEAASPPVRLDVLDPRDAEAMFAKLAGNGHDPALVAELLERDLYIPVLIASHARRIAAGWPLADVVADLPEPRADDGTDAFTDLFERLAGSYRHLDPEQQRAFRVFGVHPGATVTLGSIAAVLGLPVRLAGKAMESLMRAGLAERPPRLAAAEPGLRGFVAHDMIRACGDHLARSGADDRGAIAASLVSHYRAQLEADADRRVWFAVEAENLRDVALMGAGAEHVRLARDAGGLATLLDRFDIAESTLSHAAATAADLGDQAALASAEWALGEVGRLRGEYDAAERHYARALAVYESAGDQGGVADAVSGLAHIARLRGDYETAEAHYRSAGEVFEAGGMRGGVAGVHRGLGDIARRRGDYANARARFTTALGLFQALGKDRRAAYVQWGLGAVAQSEGEFDEAENHFRAVRAVFEAIGDRLGNANALLGLGEVARARGELPVALEHFAEARGIYEDIGLTEMAARMHSRIERLQVEDDRESSAWIFGLMAEHKGEKDSG